MQLIPMMFGDTSCFSKEGYPIIRSTTAVSEAIVIDKCRECKRCRVIATFVEPQTNRVSVSGESASLYYGCPLLTWPRFGTIEDQKLLMAYPNPTEYDLARAEAQGLIGQDTVDRWREFLQS